MASSKKKPSTRVPAPAKTKGAQDKALGKLLVANRGEIAVRIFRAAREMGIPSVAVYSEADANAFHVSQADEKICIGPAESRQSYLKIPVIIEAAQKLNVKAIHPGYGFLSENADFAKAVQKA